MTVCGYLAAGFEPVGAAFSRNFEDELDHGAAIAVVHDGEVVVDLWGGFADAAARHAWQRRSIVNVQSVTKGMAALAVAILVERGSLDYASPIARYWPAFGANGKERIALELLLSHRAGLSTVAERLDLDDLYAGDRFVSLLATMAPLHPPGERCVYHALSFGYLAAEIVRRVDGRPLGRFIAEEIARPLKLEMFLGLPEEEDSRAVEIVAGAGIDVIMEDASRGGWAAAYANPRVRPVEPNTRAWRAAGVPAGGLHTDALSLAKVYGLLACGGSCRGTQLIGRDALAEATRERFRGMEEGFGWPLRLGAGFMLNQGITFGPSQRAFGHTGWGGYFSFADPEHRLGVAYVTNLMLGADHGRERRHARLIEALSSSVPFRDDSAQVERQSP